MLATARTVSGLAYPERFYAAATYAGFGGSPNSSAKGVSNKFSNDVALLLYALYQQMNYAFIWLQPWGLVTFLSLEAGVPLNKANGRADVSSIPIVDDNDSLLDIYCRSDITALAKDRAYAQIPLDNLNIHQALQLGQDASSPYGFSNGQRCQMCFRSDPLHKVMERLATPGVRRVVIVEAGSKRVEGIISLSDVFSFLIG